MQLFSGQKCMYTENYQESYCDKRIWSITDSQAALSPLGEIDMHSRIFKKYVDSLERLAQRNKVTVRWVRSHQANRVSEMTGFLVKEGTHNPFIRPEPTCCVAVYCVSMRKINILLRTKHTFHWTRAQGVK